MDLNQERLEGPCPAVRRTPAAVVHSWQGKRVDIRVKDKDNTYRPDLILRRKTMTTLIEDIVRDIHTRSATLETIPGIRTVAISLGFTFVELENGTMGLCYTPRTVSGSCSHYARAGKLAETPVLELAELMLSKNTLERSVGVAAVTALSRLIMDSEPEAYRLADKDFLDLLPFDGAPKKVGMLGHIGPFIPFLVKQAESLVIVDDNPTLLPGFQNKGYTVSKEIEALADVNILLITGSSAAVGDFDRALEVSESAEFIGVVGPSAGWLPDAAFRRGIHAVAGTKIIDVPKARQVILEGGGTRSFSRYGQKYTVLNPDFA